MYRVDFLVQSQETFDEKLSEVSGPTGNEHIHSYFIALLFVLLLLLESIKPPVRTKNNQKRERSEKERGSERERARCRCFKLFVYLCGQK